MFLRKPKSSIVSIVRTFILIFSLLVSQLSLALTEAVQTLVNFETLGNAASKRSNQMMLIPHLEIPIANLNGDFAARFPEDIHRSLVFQRDGEWFVRWILNPEDTKWGKEVEKYLESVGVKPERKFYFKAYQTASRSYIVEDPVTGAQFSVKSSTNVTGGNWRDKKQPIGEAYDSRIMSDFLTKQNEIRAFKNFRIMDEPAILTIPSLDQAVVIRDLGNLRAPNAEIFYMPGFSALHEKAGSEIARLNGSDDPLEFWTEHYVKVAGRALGELAARTGIQFDSPHSQNFLIELDANLKPTGKLILRDMADLYVDENYMKALQGENSEILAKFTQKENIVNGIQAGFGPLHGNEHPSWVNNEQYARWKDVFFDEFEKSFKDTAGVNPSKVLLYKSQNGEYFSANYEMTASRKEYANFFEMMGHEGVVNNLGGGLRCDYIFSVGGI